MKHHVRVELHDVRSPRHVPQGRIEGKSLIPRSGVVDAKVGNLKLIRQRPETIRIFQLASKVSDYHPMGSSGLGSQGGQARTKGSWPVPIGDNDAETSIHRVILVRTNESPHAA